MDKAGPTPLGVYLECFPHKGHSQNSVVHSWEDLAGLDHLCLGVQLRTSVFRRPLSMETEGEFGSHVSQLSEC